MSSTALVASLRYRFSSGIGWNLLATAFMQGSVLIGNVVVARFLGPEVFGVYSMVLSTLFMVAGLAQFATGVTATRYVAQYQSTDKEKAAKILAYLSRLSALTGIAGAVLVALSSPWLAANVLERSDISLYLVISASYILFSVMSGYLTGAVAGLEGYKILAAVSPIQAVIHIGFCGAGALLGGGLGAIGGLTLSSFFRWVLLRIALRYEAGKQGIPWRGATPSDEEGLFARFAVPATLGGFSSLPALWLSNAFLVQQVGGYREMGLYGAAFSLRSLIIIFPAIVNNVTSSLLNHQLGLGDRGRYRKLFKANIAASAIVAFIGISCVVGFGRPLLNMFGDEFEAGYLILAILVLSTVPETLQMAIYQVIQSRGRMWLSLYAIAIPRDLSLVMMAYYFTRDHGAVGLASAYAIAWTLALFFTGIIVWNLGVMGKGPQTRTGNRQ